MTTTPVGSLLQQWTDPLAAFDDDKSTEEWKALIARALGVEDPDNPCRETFCELAYKRQIALLQARIKELKMPNMGAAGEYSLAASAELEKQYSILCDSLADIYRCYSATQLGELEQPKTLRFEHQRALEAAKERLNLS